MYLLQWIHLKVMSNKKFDKSNVQSPLKRFALLKNNNHKATKKENPVLQTRPTHIFHFGRFFFFQFAKIMQNQPFLSKVYENVG